MVKLRFYGLITGFLFFLSALAFNSFAEDKIIAVVNNEIVTQKDLNDFLNFMRIQLSEEYQEKNLENKILAMKSDLLNKLIEDRLILQEAKKNNLKVDESRIKAKIDEIKKRYPSERDFQEVLAKEGLTQADIEARIKEQMLMYQIVDYKVKSTIVINPGEVTDFYEKNIREFNLPEQGEFESMSAKAEKQIQEIYEDLAKDKDFAETAKKHSLEVNKFTAQKNRELKEEIERVVFTLKVNEISKPLKVDDNFYIFKLINIIPSRQQSLSEVQDKINGFLFNRKIQEGMAKWIEELKKNAYIKIYES